MIRMIQRRNFFEQAHVRQYERQKYQNPYFKREKKFHPWMIWGGILIVFLFLVSIPFLLGYTSPFQITDVRIQGLTTIPESEIKDLVDQQLKKHRFFLFPQSSRWFLSKQQLEETLLADEPLASLEIKTSGHTLNIDAKEQVTFVVWESGEMYTLLNLDGTVIEVLDPATANVLRAKEGKEPFPLVQGSTSAPKALAPTIPIIIDKSNTQVIVGSRELSSEKIQHILSIDTVLRALQLQPITYEIDTPAEAWVRIVTPTPDILVDLSRDPQEQGNALKTVLDTHAQESAGWEYIDVRFPENVFVK